MAVDRWTPLSEFRETPDAKGSISREKRVSRRLFLSFGIRRWVFFPAAEAELSFFDHRSGYAVRRYSYATTNLSKRKVALGKQSCLVLLPRAVLCPHHYPWLLTPLERHLAVS